MKELLKSLTNIVLPLPFIYLLSIPTWLPMAFLPYITIGSVSLYLICNALFYTFTINPESPVINFALKTLLPPIGLLLCYWLFHSPLLLLTIPAALAIAHLPINSPYKIVMISSGVLACAYLGMGACTAPIALLACSCIAASSLAMGLVFVTFLFNKRLESQNFNTIINQPSYIENQWPGILFCTFIGLCIGTGAYFVAFNTLSMGVALGICITAAIIALASIFLFNPLSLLTNWAWSKGGLILNAIISIALSASIGYGVYLMAAIQLPIWTAIILTLTLTAVATGATVYANGLKFMHNYDDFDPLKEVLESKQAKSSFDSKIKKIAIFGDSLSDPGNYANFGLWTKAFADINQGGQGEFTNLFNWNEVLINEILSGSQLVGGNLRDYVKNAIEAKFKNLPLAKKEVYATYLTNYLINKAIHNTNAEAVEQGPKNPNLSSANYAIGGATSVDYTREWFWDTQGQFQELNGTLNPFRYITAFISSLKNVLISIFHAFKSPQKFIEQFVLKNFRAEEKLFEKSKFKIENDKTLAFIFSGANDVMTITSSPLETIADVNSAIYGIKMQMVELIKKGVDQFAVFELPDITQTPSYASRPNSDPKKSALKAAVKHFNQEIKELTEKCNTERKIKVTLIPMASTFKLTLDNFTGTKPEPRRKEEDFELIKNTVYKKSKPHPQGQYFNTQNYFFWDDVHPTYHVHQMLGQVIHGYLTSKSDWNYNFDQFAAQSNGQSDQLGDKVSTNPLIKQVEELKGEITQGKGKFYDELNRIVEFMSNPANKDSQSFDSPLSFLGEQYNSVEKILAAIEEQNTQQQAANNELTQVTSSSLKQSKNRQSSEFKNQESQAPTPPPQTNFKKLASAGHSNILSQG
jgi:phospholipase/lecithinase/hemolysin